MTRGVQVPRIALVPRAKWSHADDACFLASGYGLVPDEWQATVLDGWLGERATGKWAAPRCGLAVPRQNGKNGVLEVRELYGMVALGEKFLHSAHEVKTARKAFLRLASFFENDREWPELAALVVEIRRTNGQEAIVLANGGSTEFVARSKGSGRGFTVDVLVCDEAQELSEDALAALLPTISSAPLGNPQTIMTGTPPGPSMDGAVWTRMRDAGVAGKDRRLAWFEWSVPGQVDAHQRDHWYAVNPALGNRLNIETIADELAAMDEDTFARERLGRWPSTSTIQVIDVTAWRACATQSPATDGTVSYSVDISPDGARISIGAAARTQDGPAHVEVVENRTTASGTGWVIDWLVQRWSDTAAVVIDGQSPAMALVPELSQRGVRVTVTGAADMAKACGMFDAAVSGETLTHFDQPGLNKALAGARKRDIGQAGAWGWNRKTLDSDITPLVSVTLAHYGAMTSRRKPGRRIKVKVMQ